MSKSVVRRSTDLAIVRPTAVRTAVGLRRIEGPTSVRWWTNGEAAWSEDVLAPQTVEMFETRQKATDARWPLDLFWPASARLKLVHEPKLDGVFPGHAFFVNEASKVLRAVPTETRPPRILFATRGAAAHPDLLRDEKEEPRVASIGRLRDSTDRKGWVLVDSPDIESGTFLVVPSGATLEVTEVARFTLGWLSKRDIKSQDVFDNLTQNEVATDDKGVIAQDNPALPFSERTLNIPEDRMDALEKMVTSINRAAKKLGVPGVVVEQIGEVVVPYYDEEGNKIPGMVTRATTVRITFPEQIKLPGDFAVLAKVSAIDPREPKLGNLVTSFTKDDANLPKTLWKTNMKCEHCNMERRRSAVYLVENEKTGERKKIGSSCLSSYTGFEGADQFCTLSDTMLRGMEGLDELDEGPDSIDGKPGRSRPAYMDTKTFLSIVSMIIRTDGKFVSRKEAEASNLMSTSDKAVEIGRILRAGGDTAAGVRKTITDADREVADRTVEWAAALNPKSEYEQNLKALAEVPYVPAKREGFFAAMVSGYLRTTAQKTAAPKLEKQAAEKFDHPPGLKVGDKIDITAQLVFRTDRESDYGTSYFYKLKDVYGYLYAWWGSVNAKVPRLLSWQDKVNRVVLLEDIWRHATTGSGNDPVVVGNKAETFSKMAKLLVKEIVKGTDITVPGNDGPLPYEVALTTLRMKEKEMPWETKQWIYGLLARPPLWAVETVTRDFFESQLDLPQAEMDQRVARVVDTVGQGEEDRVGVTVGDWYRFSGTVKDLSEFRGEKQVNITRGSFNGQVPPPDTLEKSAEALTAGYRNV